MNFEEYKFAGQLTASHEDFDECKYCGAWLKFERGNTCKVICPSCLLRWDCGG